MVSARRLGLCLCLCLGLSPSLLACGPDESEPESVARRFAEIARRGDVVAMLEVVERPAVERVERAAARARDQVGGRRSIETPEMLQIVGVDRTMAVADTELLDDDGEVAHVELTMTNGEVLRLELVWEQALAGDDDSPARPGGWKVRIPLPAKGARAVPGAAAPDA